MKVNGKLCYLWRPVDHEGEVLEAVVTAKQDKAAALKLLKFGRPRKMSLGAWEPCCLEPPRSCARSVQALRGDAEATLHDAETLAGIELPLFSGMAKMYWAWARARLGGS